MTAPRADSDGDNDRRSDGGSGGYNSYDDVGYGVGYASTPGEAAVVVAVEVVADIITSL